jgi:hypothetical protein
VREVRHPHLALRHRDRLAPPGLQGSSGMKSQLAPWEPANNGTGKRIWFLTRRDESLPVSDRYRFTSRGQLVKYKSFETAQKAADELNATVKVSYNVMIEFAKGSIEPEFTDEQTGRVYEAMDLADMGPHPFMAGFRALEHTEDTVLAAWEYVRKTSTAGGWVWVEKITETIKREKIDV